MTLRVIVIFSGLLLLLPITTSTVFAEESWVIFINPYDNFGKNELFQPKELPIQSGDRITWQNNDSTTHKIVSGVSEHPDYSGEYFSSENLDVGKKYSINLEHAGFAGYYYFCEIHPWFTGKIFFEDNPNVIESTLDISYKIREGKVLEVSGLVDSDFANTEYDILVYNNQNNLVYQQGNVFNQDATFESSIDISKDRWEIEQDYTLKLVYGVPSETTNIPLNIQSNTMSYDSGSLELCQIPLSDSEFIWDGVNVPNWYQISLCWFDKGLITETEVIYSLDFFRENLQR